MSRRATPRAKPAAPAAPAPLPPLARDPWAFATLAASLVLLARCWGAPLGEPVAEDFDFLRRSLFHGTGSLLDGGGSTAFWRPLAHQLYYAALGPVLVSQPWLVALLHLALLAAGALLIYRVLRAPLGPAAAWSAAAFPMLSESTRTLVSWPSQFVDVGLYFFIALAVHERWRGRMPTAMMASLAALLCKELAVVAVLLLPWLPAGGDRRVRVRWALATGSLVMLWTGLYLVIRARAHLVLPHGIESGAAAASWWTKLAWAGAGTLRAWASLPLVSTTQDVLALALGGIALGAVLIAMMLHASVRAALAERRGWLAWGAAWALLGTAAIAPIHPLWQPNRSHYPATGAGIVSGAALGAVHPLAPVAFAAGRLALMALAPAAAATVSEEPAASGAFMDFAQLSRLQRFMSESRRALQAEFPHPEHGSHIMTGNLPRGLIYALGEDRAVQVWYRDTTLATTTFRKLSEDTTQRVTCCLQYQQRAATQILVSGMAGLREQLRAYGAMRDHDHARALWHLARADSLEPDPRNEVFRGNNAAYRALALYRMGRVDEAAPEAERALRLDENDPNAWLAVASVREARGDLEGAIRALDEVIEREPGRAQLVQLRAQLAARLLR